MGELKGIVRDSAYNFVLSTATVSVYRDADSSLLKFSIPNNFGEFSIPQLPVNERLRMIITHVGYVPLLKKVVLPRNAPVLNFGNINMRPANNADSTTLEDVVVTAVAPMRMNGDTLEFNADAFKLDSSSTTEDLMRKLPGFTIWGDGDITFNGKKISSILVNGKPFMGGDFSVITQNLPKTSVDKVQVYSQHNEKNPLDSTLNANIKLKKEITSGHFGKVSAGLGTDGRYAVDGMLGIFNPKLQLSVVAAHNNVNKLAGDIRTLVSNSTFKSAGNSITYQPDFGMPGLNKPVAAGISFQYDMLPEVNYYNANRLNADYFLSRNQLLLLNNTTTQTVLGADSLLTQYSNSNQSSTRTHHVMNGKYEHNTRRYRLNMVTKLTFEDSKTSDVSQSEQLRTGTGQVSNSISSGEGSDRNRYYDLALKYIKMDPDQYQKDKRVINAYDIDYDIKIQDNKSYNRRNTAFRSFTDPSANSDYSRLYDKQDALTIRHHVSLSYPELKKLLFGHIRINDFGVSLQTDAWLNNERYTDRVLDLDVSTKEMRLNNYLTNTRDLNTFKLNPSINIQQSFYKMLSNRYSKYLTLTGRLQTEHYSWRHRATQQKQNIDYYYNRFVPSVSVVYQNNQYGAYDAYVNMEYGSTISYPGIDQLAPLIDSSNVLFLPMGNMHLKPSRDEGISVYYNYDGRTKNPVTGYINVRIARVNNFITDSIIYDDIGRRTQYYVNLNGRRYASINASIRKAYQKGKASTWKGGLQTDINFSRNPNYINNTYNISHVTSSNFKLDLDYTYKSLFALKIQQGLNYNRSVQEGFNNNRLNSNVISTMLSGSLQLPKNVTWSSNISFNSARADGSDAVNFAIWNASLTYRCLKEKRGELKFSALDLLRQNKSVITTVSGNAQSFGYVNVLQQYFMFTVSYYPRKFGR